MQNTQIQLTVEEALEFQKFDSHINGFVLGVKTMAEHSKRMKLDEMIAARKPSATPPTEPPPEM